MNYQASYILKIGDFMISETVVVSWVIIACLGIVSYLLTRNLKKEPTSKVQVFLEFAITSLNKLVKETMGERAIKTLPFIIPYICSLFLFFLFSNIIGLVGLRSPTVDLDTTLAWATITVVMIYYTALKNKGMGFFKGFIDPVPIFLPINIVGEIARPISLSFRPFGNIMGGTIIMSLVYQLLAFISKLIVDINIPFGQLIIPVPLHLYFDIFAGCLQAFIFIMLTMVFVGSEAEVE
ncbi:F0F1 ATP synthase subunit A [Metaclostridioides mangenotii]|jgi:F-type H+-transporting ATPase subunit a|uniref:F0F1 ATP synthase subunit A n=1 Tax=Metaclostridioides mangenotii TaxID=1540 RepID=UPI0004839D37|nr:F0F1 ATP synthase subunit A [Clostridioides mangenotii]